MRLSRALVPTLREPPGEARTPGHQLLTRGGFVRGLASGVVQLFPFGRRVVRRLLEELTSSLEELGAEEFAGAHTLADGPREAFVRQVLGVVKSYKQVPRRLWQTRRRFRDRERSRPGLLELRETELLEVYELLGPGAEARTSWEALCGVLRRLGLAGNGGDSVWVACEAGTDTRLVCPGCDSVHEAQTVPVAAPSPVEEAPALMKAVETPDCKTIEEVARYLGIERDRTAKAVFFAREDGTLVFAVVRGDSEVSEAKLARAAGARSLRPATEDEIRAVGAEPGYASPVELSGKCLVLVDALAATTPNLVGGANRPGFHYQNTCFGRDYQGEVIDLVLAAAGTPCPGCEAPLEERLGVEVARWTDLGTGLAESAGALFQSQAGKMVPLHLTVAAVDLYALLGLLAERRCGEQTVPWPPDAAPFDVHLVSLAGKNEACAAEVERLYQALRTHDVRVLLDDRKARAGEKFADGDLIGPPLRVVFGPRGMEGREAEVKDLVTGETFPTRLHLVVDRVRARLERMRA